MIIDSSAIVAILKLEPERNAFLRAMYFADTRAMSAGNYLETALVVDGLRDVELVSALEGLFVEFEIHVEPVTLSQAIIAREAHRQYGRGSEHPAKLNFGDCFAYALAIERDEPLLYKGDDFVHTDVISALS